MPGLQMTAWPGEGRAGGHSPDLGSRRFPPTPHPRGAALSPQYTTRGCRTSWRRSAMRGGPSAPCGRSTERSSAGRLRRPSASARSSWPRSWRSCGRRSRCGGRPRLGGAEVVDSPDGCLVAHRSTWRCSGSWPSSACRSRRRSGSCAWSSRSRLCRCAPRCPPSPCPMPRHAPSPGLPLAAGSGAEDCPDRRLSLSPAAGHARGRGCVVPALRPNKLPGHLQPRGLRGGLPHAHGVHEPAGPRHRQPLPQHAWGRSR